MMGINIRIRTHHVICQAAPDLIALPGNLRGDL
jgi:hypothetical protein